MQSLEQLKLVSAFYPLNIDFFLPSHLKNAYFKWQAHKDNKNCNHCWHIFTCTWHFSHSNLCSTCFTCSSSFKLITHLWIGIVFITILPWENKGTKKRKWLDQGFQIINFMNTSNLENGSHSQDNSVPTFQHFDTTYFLSFPTIFCSISFAYLRYVVLLLSYLS